MIAEAFQCQYNNAVNRVCTMYMCHASIQPIAFDNAQYFAGYCSDHLAYVLHLVVFRLKKQLLKCKIGITPYAICAIHVTRGFNGLI